ncbi:MAG TPA: hypothetical protein VI756_16900 [Blastocatellia bacterium]
MKALTAIGLSATFAAGLALLQGSAVAQQKSLKEQIQGPWSLASCNSTNAKGEKSDYCANNPKGILILAGNGNYANTIIAGGRKDPNAPGVADTFGTWSVNEADKTLTRHMVGSNFPTIEGKDFKVNISLNGEEMRLTGDVSFLGVEGVLHLDSTYRRFK